MRVLLDEHLPIGFARCIAGHEVSTVRAEGWSGIENGALLTAAADGFDVLLTNDSGIEHQQNLAEFDLCVVVVGAPTNKLEDLVSRLPAIESALQAAMPGTVVRVAG